MAFQGWTGPPAGTTGTKMRNRTLRRQACSSWELRGMRRNSDPAVFAPGACAWSPAEPETPPVHPGRGPGTEKSLPVALQKEGLLQGLFMLMNSLSQSECVAAA